MKQWREVPIDGECNPKDAVAIGRVYPFSSFAGDASGRIIFNAKDYGVIGIKSKRDDEETE